MSTNDWDVPEAPSEREPFPELPGYAVGDVLGVGASGEVRTGLRARDGLTVALKLVRAEFVGNDSAWREAAVLSRLGGEHVVRVHESVGLADGSVVLVLDLLDGGSLWQVVSARGRLSPAEAVTVLSPVASGLGTLHAAGVIHGDVSPGNVLFERGGRPRLSDLGTARIRGDCPGEVSGTDGFVAPEVLLGCDPSAASDVYAVAALGWFCLTGTVPDNGPVRGRLVDHVPPELREHPLVGVLQEAFLGDAAARPDAPTLAASIYDAAEPAPLRLVTPSDEVSGLTRRIRQVALAERPADEAARPRHKPARPRGRHRANAGRAVAGIIAVAVLVSIGVVIALGLSGGRRPSESHDADRHTGGPPVARAAEDRPGTPVQTRRSAPRDDARALVQSLVDERAQAWTQGVAAGLHTVNAPGSPALRRDVELLAAVQRNGGRYRGLRFTVRSARTVEVRAGEAEVEASVDATAYDIVSRDGTVHRSAKAGAPLVLELLWGDVGWRISDVRRA